MARRLSIDKTIRDYVAALNARITELEIALEPFAEYANTREAILPEWNDDVPVMHIRSARILAGDLRRARDILKPPAE